MGKKKFDLNNLDTKAKADTGAVLQVEHPVDRTRLGIEISLVGADSDVYQRQVNSMANKRAKRLRPGQFVPPTAEETTEAALELLAACTLGWKGMLLNGQEIPFSQENAVMIYRQFPWIKEQVDAFIGERANFLS